MRALFLQSVRNLLIGRRDLGGNLSLRPGFSEAALLPVTRPTMAVEVPSVRVQ